MSTKYRIDERFRDRQRPLTPEEYDGLAASIGADGPRPGSVVVADVRGDLVLMDGHNTVDICDRKGIGRPEPVVLKLPTYELALEWIDANQHNRRNLSEETRRKYREERRQRVAQARQDGQSTRAIAEAEGVSQKTVRNDLEAATEEGYSVDPPDGKVTGLDGKTRPAGQPAPTMFCRRCRCHGPVKNCKDCAAVRGETNGRPRKKRTPSTNGQPAFTMAAFNEQAGRLLAELDKLAHYHRQTVTVGGRSRHEQPAQGAEYRSIQGKIVAARDEAGAWHARLRQEAGK